MAPEGTADVDHRSAFHGGAASARVVPSGVGDMQRNRERSTSRLVTKFGVPSAI